MSPAMAGRFFAIREALLIYSFIYGVDLFSCNWPLVIPLVNCLLPFHQFFLHLSFLNWCICCSVTVRSNSLRPQEPQHARLLCPSLSPWVLKLVSVKSVLPSNHLILCRPLLLLPSTFHGIRVFSNELALCIRWPKYWSFSFSISPSSEYSGLISFRIEWFDLLAVQATLKSLLRHHSSKVSILGRSTFFVVQLSHPYMTTGKTVALTRRTFVSCYLICCLGWS